MLHRPRVLTGIRSSPAGAAQQPPAPHRAHGSGRPRRCAILISVRPGRSSPPASGLRRLGASVPPVGHALARPDHQAIVSPWPQTTADALHGEKPRLLEGERYRAPARGVPGCALAVSKLPAGSVRSELTEDGGIPRQAPGRGFSASPETAGDPTTTGTGTAEGAGQPRSSSPGASPFTAFPLRPHITAAGSAPRCVSA